MPSRAKVLASRKIYTGRIISLREDRVREPGGVLTRRELVVHPGAVVVLPRLPDGRVVLVRQYRHAAGRALWELVAGTLEPGEKPLQAARRELREETGYLARRMTPVLDFFSSPGFLTERMYLVEAHGLTRSRPCPDTDEHITVGRFTLRQIAALLRRNTFRDAKTLVGLLWILRGRQSDR
jgi:ADP-ribose diphosphatase